MAFFEQGLEAGSTDLAFFVGELIDRKTATDHDKDEGQSSYPKKGPGLHVPTVLYWNGVIDSWRRSR